MRTPVLFVAIRDCFDEGWELHLPKGIKLSIKDAVRNHTSLGKRNLEVLH